MDTVFFDNGKGQRLEALYEERSSARGVVIAHPHPLYGGDMNNPVVESVAAVFGRRNFSTLRPNFRGVGKSEGQFDGGIGEQEDIAAAVNFLVQKGKTEVHLAGYSFGTWVIAGMENFGPEVKALLFVSPPAAFIPFPEQLRLPLLELVITGENDEFAPPELLEKQVKGWNRDVRFEVVDFADHFYFGSFRELETQVATWLGSRGEG